MCSLTLISSSTYFNGIFGGGDGDIFLLQFSSYETYRVNHVVSNFQEEKKTFSI